MNQIVLLSPRHTVTRRANIPTFALTHSLILQPFLRPTRDISDLTDTIIINGTA